MHPTSQSLRALAAGVCLVLAGGAGAAPGEPDPIASVQEAFTRSVQPGQQADLHRDLLSNVLQRIRRNHATQVDLAALTAAATKVMDPLPERSGDPADVFKKAVNEALGTLDPYSRYLDAPALAMARNDATGSFAGLGLEVQSSDGAVRVVAPIPGSPAARAGLAAGDLIVRVDDLPLGGLPLADAIARMRGAPGTAVSLTVQRAGIAQEFSVSLTRETIRRQQLRSSMEGDVLVLQLSGFSGAVSASLAQAIAAATAERQPAAVVLDLRGNPGGLLREAVAVADLFLNAGDIVTLYGAGAVRQRGWQADAAELLPGLPMVVLIDKRSASASELVADALQFNKRATVMGQRSFGKGSVQTTFPLGGDRGALKLTTALYHGPSGQTVHKSGVTPDIELLAAGAAPADAAAPVSKLRVDPARCGPAKVADAVLSCALAYLRAGSADAFSAALPD